MTNSNPVDAVITWVDGYDPNHQLKLNAYLASLGVDRPFAAAPTRFNQRGEINYCIQSILHYAPWINQIYLVTDQQRPAILSTLELTGYADKVRVIDHQHIFRGYEHCLPTFNSLSIESLLWRIEGLSERFIYFNDDCLLLRPIAYEDFFREDKLVLRGWWKTQTNQKRLLKYLGILNGLLHRSVFRVVPEMHRLLQENSARVAGWEEVFFHLPHIPFALHQSTFKTFFDARPDLLLENIRHPLRAPSQFWPISLACHLEIQKQQVVVDKLSREISVHAGFHSGSKIRRRLRKAEQELAVKFFCMQSLDEGEPGLQAYLLEWLDNHIPLTV